MKEKDKNSTEYDYGLETHFTFLVDKICSFFKLVARLFKKIFRPVVVLIQIIFGIAYLAIHNALQTISGESPD